MKTVFLLAAVSLSPVLCPAADPAPQPAVATKFLGLFQDLRDAEAQRAAGKYRHTAFRITATEINDYMRWALRTTPRPGLDSVTVKIFRNNYVSTFAMVDFDAVEKWKPGTIPTLLRPVLSGKKSIWIDYRFQAANDKVTFSVEKAYYGSVRLPAFFVEKMIEIVAARQPEKYDTSKPLPLPFGLRKVWTEEQVAAGEN
jgi:hypothetical protein